MKVLACFISLCQNQPFCSFQIEEDLEEEEGSFLVTEDVEIEEVDHDEDSEDDSDSVIETYALVALMWFVVYL